MTPAEVEKLTKAAREGRYGHRDGAGEVRGHRQQAALKEQRFRGARSSSLSIRL